ncbi:MAG: glycosyltransferase family 61 protein [Bacteroidetes bacterium]|nr:glycosyltransferase family 61 protein [Bacteroidota bacterium]
MKIKDYFIKILLIVFFINCSKSNSIKNMNLVKSENSYITQNYLQKTINKNKAKHNHITINPIKTYILMGLSFFIYCIIYQCITTDVHIENKDINYINTKQNFKNYTFNNITPNELKKYLNKNYSNIDLFANNSSLYEVNTKDSFIRMQDVFIYGNHQNIFGHQNQYNQGGCRKTSFVKKKKFLKKYQKAFNRNSIKKIHNAILISQFWGFGHFHWLIENYLRLNLVYDLIKNKKQNNYTFLSYSHLDDKKYYDIYHFDHLHKIEYYNDEAIYYIKNLIIPKSIECGEVNAKSLKLWRIHYKKFILKNNYSSNKNIDSDKINILFQVRKNGTKRSIINNDDLIYNIKNLINSYNRSKFNFQIFSYQNISFEEIINKHYYADIIIGPHGAGLSNMIFTNFKNTTSIIEIHPKVYSHKQQTNLCMNSISNILEKRYFSIYAENGNSYNSMYVSVEKLTNILKNVLNLY